MYVTSAPALTQRLTSNSRLGIIPLCWGYEGFENTRKLKVTNRFRVGARHYLTTKPKRSISHQRQP